MSFVVDPMANNMPEPNDQPVELSGASADSTFGDEPVVLTVADFKKGDKIRVIKRTSAFDPYSLENVYISSHTPGRVVVARDDRRSLAEHVTVMLSSFDNGNGRIVQINAADLSRVD